MFRALSRDRQVYLVDAFESEELAKPVNHTLVIGSYLLILGFILLRMQTGNEVATYEQLIVYLSSSLGFVFLVLGLAHFFNMFVIHCFRDHQSRKQAHEEYAKRLSKNEIKAEVQRWHNEDVLNSARSDRVS